MDENFFKVILIGKWEWIVKAKKKRILLFKICVCSRGIYHIIVKTLWQIHESIIPCVFIMYTFSLYIIPIWTWLWYYNQPCTSFTPLINFGIWHNLVFLFLTHYYIFPLLCDMEIKQIVFQMAGTNSNWQCTIALACLYWKNVGWWIRLDLNIYIFNP